MEAAWVPAPPLDAPGSLSYTGAQNLAQPLRGNPHLDAPYLEDSVTVQDDGEKQLVRFRRLAAEGHPASVSEWLPQCPGQLLIHAGSLWTLTVDFPADGGQCAVVELDPLTLATRARYPWPTTGPDPKLPTEGRFFPYTLHHDGPRTLRVIAWHYDPFVQGVGSARHLYTFLFHSDTGEFSNVVECEAVPEGAWHATLPNRTTLVVGDGGTATTPYAYDVLTGEQVPVPPLPEPAPRVGTTWLDRGDGQGRLSPVPEGHLAFPSSSATMGQLLEPSLQVVVEASVPEMFMLGVGETTTDGRHGYLRWEPDARDRELLTRWQAWEQITAPEQLQSLLERSVEVQGVMLRTGNREHSERRLLGGDLLLTMQQTVLRVETGLRPVKWDREHDTPAPYHEGRLYPPLMLFSMDPTTTLMLQWIPSTPEAINGGKGILRWGTLGVDSTEPTWLGYLSAPPDLPAMTLVPRAQLYTASAQWHLVMKFTEENEQGTSHVYSLLLPPLVSLAMPEPQWSSAGW